MRVITGSARGRKLVSPAGQDVRPTVDRVKEAVFSILQFELEGRRVLDLFAGSGQLGIEALSRGAASAVFIEQNKAAAEIVRKNVKLTGLTERARMLHTDALRYLAGATDVFDVVFLDPPYGQGLIQKALPLLEPLMAAGAVWVCETPADEVLPSEVGAFHMQKTYGYSGTKITVYRNTDT